MPRPSADSARLEKWFTFLKRVQKNLAKIGKALKHKNRVRASHEKIRTERSSNAANNVSFVFGFKYCHLPPPSSGRATRRRPAGQPARFRSSAVLVVSAAAAPPESTLRTRPGESTRATAASA